MQPLKRAMKPLRWAVGVVLVALVLAAFAPSLILWRGRRSLARASRYHDHLSATTDDCLWAHLRSDEERTTLSSDWSTDEMGTALAPWLLGVQPVASLPPPARADLDRLTETHRAALRCEPRINPRTDYTALNAEFIIWGRMTALDVRARLEAGDADGAATECARALRWVAALTGPYGSLGATGEMTRALELPCLAAKAKDPSVAADFAEAAKWLPTTEAALGVRWFIFARHEFAEVTSASTFDFARLPDLIRLARQCSKSERLFDTFLAQANDPGARAVTDSHFADLRPPSPFEDEELWLPALDQAMGHLEQIRGAFARLASPGNER